MVSRTGKIKISLSAFAPGIWFRETGSAVPSRVSLLILDTQEAESGTSSRDSSRFLRWRSFIYLNRHTPSGQSRAYRITHLRTDGVHCRESAGTGPVNLKVVPNECCLGRSPCVLCVFFPFILDVRLVGVPASLSHTHYWYEVSMLKVPAVI